MTLNQLWMLKRIESNQPVRENEAWKLCDRGWVALEGERWVVTDAGHAAIEARPRKLVGDGAAVFRRPY